jgi:putative PIN family toxin of toxin-antitoxin system
LIKLVLDSNVLISGIIFGGKPRRLLQHIIEGRLELYLSKEIIDEVIGILRKKFKYPHRMLLAVENELASISIIIEPDFKIDFITEDYDDNKLLECALAAECEYIVSGDNHLLSVGAYQSIQIKGVSEFLDLI